MLSGDLTLNQALAKAQIGRKLVVRLQDRLNEESSPCAPSIRSSLTLLEKAARLGDPLLLLDVGVLVATYRPEFFQQAATSEENIVFEGSVANPESNRP